MRVFSFCYSNGWNDWTIYFWSRFNEIFSLFFSPFYIFFIVFLKPAQSSGNCLGVKLKCFSHLLLGLWQKSCNFSKWPLLLKSHHAWLLMGLKWSSLHLADFWNFSPLVCVIIYFVKIWLLTRPHLLQLPLIILTSFCVLGFKFPNKVLFTVWL